MRTTPPTVTGMTQPGSESSAFPMSLAIKSALIYGPRIGRGYLFLSGNGNVPHVILEPLTIGCNDRGRCLKPSDSSIILSVSASRSVPIYFRVHDCGHEMTAQSVTVFRE